MFVQEGNDLRHIPIDRPDDMDAALPAGIYRARSTMQGIVFSPDNGSSHRVIEMNSDPYQRVAQEIREFFNDRITQILAQHQLPHRRGILLHGAPGTGKTSIVRAMFPTILAAGAVVLLEPTVQITVSFVNAIRLSDPDRPVVIIWDEFDQVVDTSVAYTLQVLDGVSSPDHLLTIATTNYLNRIPKTITARPSRFSLVLHVPALDVDIRMAYARELFPMLDTATVSALEELTRPLSLDFFGEALKLVLIGWDVERIKSRFDAIDISKQPRYEDYEDENIN